MCSHEGNVARESGQFLKVLPLSSHFHASIAKQTAGCAMRMTCLGEGNAINQVSVQSGANPLTALARNRRRAGVGSLFCSNGCGWRAIDEGTGRGAAAAATGG